MSNEEPSPESQKTPKTYGKRPVWHWVVIYVIVAVILYGLAYLIFFHKSGAGTGGYNY